MIASQGFVLES